MSSFRIKPKKDQQGFALLLAALMSLIVLVVGSSILNTAFKQVTLTEVATESERAFHAAYAGVECAQFWNVDDVWDPSPNPMAPLPNQSIRCMDQSVVMTTDYDHAVVPESGTNANAIKTIQFDWTLSPGATGDSSYNLCTEITVYKYFSPLTSVAMDVLPSGAKFANGFDRTCVAGVECTVVESRGYSRGCSRLGSVRTVEREVVVRF